MALLYSLIGATGHEEPGWQYYKPDPEQDGAFAFPDDVSDRLHKFGARGKKLWETSEEHRARLHEADSARAADPRSLYAAVQEIADLAKTLAGLREAPAPAPVPAADPAELAALRADLDALRAELARRDQPAPALETAPEPAGEPEPEAPKAPARRR
jgi:hypothetical protein